MKKILIAFFLVMQATMLKAAIIETTSIEEIKSYADEHTLVLFDMDDTLTDSPLHLGSGAWRQYIREKIPQYEQTNGPVVPNTNLHDLFTFYVASRGAIAPVEDELLVVVADWQQKNIPVFVLTARGTVKWYASLFEGVDLLTHTQLNRAGYQFTNSILPAGFENLESNRFSQGVFFSSGNKKGPFLKGVLEDTGYTPQSVLFIDDKLDQILSVEKTMEELHIPFTGVWYRKAEENHKSFDSAAATQQLKSLLEDDILLSDEEAEALAHDVKKPADDFFFEFLKEFNPSSLEN